MRKTLIKIALIFFFLSINSCQGLNEFIPPDLEEKLCITAIIDNENEKNVIIVEKSFQNEYPDEGKSNLENLAVQISSEEKIIFEYFNQKSQNRFDTILLPELNLIPDKKYTLTVSEKSTKTVSSVIAMPPTPSVPEIIIESVVKTLLPSPHDCHNPVTSVILNIKFKSEDKLFYYINVEGHMNSLYKDTLGYLINFNIIESNSPFFQTVIQSFRGVGFRSCWSDLFFIPFNDYRTCFINGETIPENECTLKIRIDLNPDFFDYSKPVRINLFSIPKELYEYEKNYMTYLESYQDPFSEPVFLRGNLKGGSGIFAICFRKQDSLILPTK